MKLDLTMRAAVLTGLTAIVIGCAEPAQVKQANDYRPVQGVPLDAAYTPPVMPYIPEPTVSRSEKHPTTYDIEITGNLPMRRKMRTQKPEPEGMTTRYCTSICICSWGSSADAVSDKRLQEMLGWTDYLALKGHGIVTHK